MSVRPEAVAVEALREHLLLKLPAKVTSINATRAAVLKAGVAGPYTVVGDLSLGAVIGTGTTVSLTTGNRTDEEVVTEVDAAGISGLDASSDSKDRLVITADAPAAGSPSAVYLGPNGTAGANEAFGWPAGGAQVVRHALVAPGWDGITDGEPEVMNLGAGMFIILGQRSVQPREPGSNRSDVHRVQVAMEVFTCEPGGRVDSSHEFSAAAVQCVREVILEDRTLGGTVYLCELPSVQYQARVFRFTDGGPSGLYASAPMTALIHVFERS